jgi:DNA-binding response OmpR family regulator
MEEQDQCAGRILVVDDEKPVGQVLQQWLTRKGYHVRYAPGFGAVQQSFAEEEFDLVTLDIMMPEVDGLQVLRWLKEHYPDVGVIMATALGDLDSVLEAMRLGAINYLIKPFNMELIAAEMERGMERQRLIAENRSYQQELEQKVEERTRELREAHARLERQLRELEGRDGLVRFQMRIHTLEEAYEEVLKVVQQVLGVEQAILYRPAADGEILEGVAVIPEGRADGTAPLPIGEEAHPVVRAFVSGEPVAGEVGEVMVPMAYREEVLGVLQVCCPRATEVNPEEFLEVLRRLSGEAALALRGAVVAEELESGTFSLDELEEID